MKNCWCLLACKTHILRPHFELDVLYIFLRSFQAHCATAGSNSLRKRAKFKDSD